MSKRTRRFPALRDYRYFLGENGFRKVSPEDEDVCFGVEKFRKFCCPGGVTCPNCKESPEKMFLKEEYRETAYLFEDLWTSQRLTSNVFGETRQPLSFLQYRPSRKIGHRFLVMELALPGMPIQRWYFTHESLGKRTVSHYRTEIFCSCGESWKTAGSYFARRPENLFSTSPDEPLEWKQPHGKSCDRCGKDLALIMKLLEDQEDYFAMNGQRSTLTGEDTEEFCKTYSVYYEKTLEESGFDLFTSILHGETLPRALSELVNSVLLADAGRRNWHRLARQLTVEAKRQWLDQLLSKERSSSLTCSLPALS